MFCLPMVNILGPVSWAPIVFLLGLLLSVLSLFLLQTRLDFIDPLVFLLVLVCMIPWIWSSDYVSQKTFNHIAAFITVIFVYGIFTRSALIFLFQNGQIKIVFKALGIGAIFLSLYVIFEFVSETFLGIGVSSWPIHITRPEFDLGRALGGIVHRPRGFSSEPGNLALYFDFMIFLLPFCFISQGMKVLSFVVFIISYLLLMSAASIASILVASFLYIAVRYRQGRPLSTKLVLFLIGAFCIFFYLAYDYIVLYVTAQFLPKLSIIFGQADSLSSADRLGRYILVLRTVMEYPFGIGFGITPGLELAGNTYNGLEVTAGQVSFPGTLLVSGGIPALVVYLVIWGMQLRRAYNLDHLSAEMVAGGAALFLHYIFVGAYWFPFLWFYWALISALEVYQRTDIKAQYWTK